MLHARLVKALEKVGATVTSHGNDGTQSNRFYAEKGSKYVTWHNQDGFVVCLRTPSPDTDAQTDCFCDHYHRTMRSAVAEFAK